MFILHYDDGSELHVPDLITDCGLPKVLIPKLVFPVLNEPYSQVLNVSYVKECDCCEKND